MTRLQENILIITRFMNACSNKLDNAVDLFERLHSYPNEAKRIEFLFELYEKYAQLLMTKERVKRK